MLQFCFSHVTVEMGQCGESVGWTQIPMKLLVVIVNYRVANLTIDCLHQVATEARRVPHVHGCLRRVRQWPAYSIVADYRCGRGGSEWRHLKLGVARIPKQVL